MAESNPNLFKRLRKLFSTDVIIRNVGGNQLRVIDTDGIQADGNIKTNRRIDRYSRLLSATPYSPSTGQLQLYTRLELFRDYEAMDTDSIISSALDIYADECTAKNEYGDVMAIKTSNEAVQKVLHNLYYDVLNIEFNLWPWIRNMIKYGDFYLHLRIAEKYGVIGVEPISSYEMIREENMDPENPYQVRFKRDFTALSSTLSAALNKDATLYDNYEIAHFRLLGDTNFLPYGRSLIEPARKVWKQIVLMEDAMLIHRIMRAPDKRIFKIDIGNIPPSEVDAYMESIISKMKKVPYVDPETGQYNLKYNMQNILEDFYLPVRGSESGTTIDTLSGVQYDSIQDIDYLKNRLLGSLKIPKAYLGYEEDTTGKATLASQDFRFARTIERIQKIVISELYKIGLIHLYTQGFKDENFVDFSLQLTAPSSIYEKEKVELWTSKVTLAGDIIDKKLFSRSWIYENLFNMAEDQYLRMTDEIVKDLKQGFRFKQIEEEGNDPVKTGQSFGTPHDIASLYKGNGGVPKGYDERTAQMPEKGWPGAGRPKEPGTYGKHAHPLGWDPLGTKTATNVSENDIEQHKKILDSKSEAIKATYIQESFTKSDDLLDEKLLLDEDL